MAGYPLRLNGKKIERMLEQVRTVTYRHIEAGSGERSRHRIHKLSRNTKVAQLDYALLVQQNVGWLDVAVDSAL